MVDNVAMLDIFDDRQIVSIILLAGCRGIMVYRSTRVMLVALAKSFDLKVSLVFAVRISEVPYVVAAWRHEHPSEQIPDGQVFT